MDSILTSIKKLLGITDEYEHFDADIIMHINSVFLVLNQMGVGPDIPFIVTDASQTWSEFSEDINLIEMIKSYMGLKVQMIFDPPTSSTIAEAKNRMISEFEWRLNVAVDPSFNA